MSAYEASNSWWRVPPSRDTLIVLLGQAVGGLGILIQFFAEPELFAKVLGIPFPPGLVYIAGAGAVVWLDQRSTWSPMAAVALSTWIALGGLLSGDLINNLESANSGVVAGNVVMLAGLVFSSVAGLTVIARNRGRQSQPRPHPLSSANPRRGAYLATVGMLALAALSIAVAEQFEFQGGGPYPLMILMVAVALIRAQYVLGMAIVFAIVYFGSALASPAPMDRLSTPSAVVEFGATVVHLLSLLGVVVAGLVANAPTQTSNHDRDGAVR